MMNDTKQQHKKARPGSWPGLLLMLCLAVCLAILGSQTAEYLLSFRREATPVSAQAARSLPAAKETEQGKINVNTATLADFQQAEGVGPALAQAIVDARDSLGGFLFIEELKDVPGIGEKRFQALQALFYCPAGDPAAQ